jgi:hypothetical protein
MKLDRLAYPGPDDLNQLIIEASAGPKGKEIRCLRCGSLNPCAVRRRVTVSIADGAV